MTKPLCIYHGHCDDGFAAAWAVRQALGAGNVEFHPGVYQQDPPDVYARDIIMVDFSYKKDVLGRMATQCRSLLILDHHKTAAEDLAWLPAPPASFGDWRRQVWSPSVAEIPRLAALFDMERSGAGLAWDYFNLGARIRFIDYIEDRDLWRKKLPGGDEFTIALRSYPQDFTVWDELAAKGVPALVAEGHSIQRYYRQRVTELKRSAYPAELGGHKIWIANAPYFAASEVAGELCEREGAAFGACYFEVTSGRWQYSLRSRPKDGNDFDVSEVAKAFGGGGHKGAAGFTVDKPAHVTQPEAA